MQELIRDHVLVKQELIRVRKQQERMINVVEDLVQCVTTAQQKQAAVEDKLERTLRFLEMAFDNRAGANSAWPNQRDVAEWIRLNGNKRMRPTLALQDSKQATGDEPTLQWLPPSGVVTTVDSGLPLSPSLRTIAAATEAMSLDSPFSGDTLAAAPQSAVQSAKQGISDLYASSTPVEGLGSPIPTGQALGSSSEDVAMQGCLPVHESDLASLPRLQSLDLDDGIEGSQSANAEAPREID